MPGTRRQRFTREAVGTPDARKSECTRQNLADALGLSPAVNGAFLIQEPGAAVISRMSKVVLTRKG